VIGRAAIVIAGLTAVTAMAILGRATPEKNAAAVLASPAQVVAAAVEEPGLIARDGGRWSIVLGNDLARPPEREHGTDGLMGSLPFRTLLEGGSPPIPPPRWLVPRPAPIQTTRIGGLSGWQTDPYAK
jgi:hypothetical protein